MFEKHEGLEEEEMRVGDVVAVGETEVLQGLVVGDVRECLVCDVGLVEDEGLQGREEVKVGARDRATREVEMVEMGEGLEEVEYNVSETEAADQLDPLEVFED